MTSSFSSLSLSPPTSPQHQHPSAPPPHHHWNNLPHHHYITVVARDTRDRGPNTLDNGKGICTNNISFQCCYTSSILSKQSNLNHLAVEEDRKVNSLFQQVLVWNFEKVFFDQGKWRGAFVLTKLWRNKEIAEGELEGFERNTTKVKCKVASKLFIRRFGDATLFQISKTTKKLKNARPAQSMCERGKQYIFQSMTKSYSKGENLPA